MLVDPIKLTQRAPTQLNPSAAQRLVLCLMLSSPPPRAPVALVSGKASLAMGSATLYECERQRNRRTTMHGIDGIRSQQSVKRSCSLNFKQKIPALFFCVGLCIYLLCPAWNTYTRGHSNNSSTYSNSQQQLAAPLAPLDKVLYGMARVGRRLSVLFPYQWFTPCPWRDSDSWFLAGVRGMVEAETAEHPSTKQRAPTIFMVRLEVEGDAVLEFLATELSCRGLPWACASRAVQEAGKEKSQRNARKRGATSNRFIFHY